MSYPVATSFASQGDVFSWLASNSLTTDGLSLAPSSHGAPAVLPKRMQRSDEVKHACSPFWWLRLKGSARPSRSSHGHRSSGALRTATSSGRNGLRQRRLRGQPRNSGKNCRAADVEGMCTPGTGGLRILNPAAILAAPASLASTSRRTVRPARRTYWWASGLPRAGLTALPTWDQDQSRSRHLIAVADRAGPVAESSETNNPRCEDSCTINTPVDRDPPMFLQALDACGGSERRVCPKVTVSACFCLCCAILCSSSSHLSVCSRPAQGELPDFFHR